MSYFLSAVHSIRFDLGGEGDQADKLSCRYSVVLLVILCAVVSSKQYAGDPIECWVCLLFLHHSNYLYQYFFALTHYMWSVVLSKNLTKFVQLGAPSINSCENVKILK